MMVTALAERDLFEVIVGALEIGPLDDEFEPYLQEQMLSPSFRRRFERVDQRVAQGHRRPAPVKPSTASNKRHWRKT